MKSIFQRSQHNPRRSSSTSRHRNNKIHFVNSRTQDTRYNKPRSKEDHIPRSAVRQCSSIVDGHHHAPGASSKTSQTQRKYLRFAIEWLLTVYLLQDTQDGTSSNTSSDRVEVIKLAPTNGSPGISVPSYANSTGYSDSLGDTPLNLSMKPSTSNATNLTSSSLNSLSNMSANLGVDRICKCPLRVGCRLIEFRLFLARRKPGPKPRRVIQPPSHLPPGAPSASLQQLFASADSPRPPSRTDDTMTTMCTTTIPSTASSSIGSLPISIHKDGRPRNLGRGISKPKKNTVASLLAQSRALGNK